MLFLAPFVLTLPFLLPGPGPGPGAESEGVPSWHGARVALLITAKALAIQPEIGLTKGLVTPDLQAAFEEAKNGPPAKSEPAIWAANWWRAAFRLRRLWFTGRSSQRYFQPTSGLLWPAGLSTACCIFPGAA